MLSMRWNRFPVCSACDEISSPYAQCAIKFYRWLRMRGNSFLVCSACDEIGSAYAQHTHAIIFENDSKIPNYLKRFGGLMPIFFTLLSFSFIHTIQSRILTSMNIRRGSSPFPHRWTAQWQTPPWGAESGFELGPALARADMLPTEPCRTHYNYNANFAYKKSKFWKTV